MGYYTDYELTWDEESEHNTAIMAVLKRLEILDDVEPGYAFGNCKWYEHTTDIAAVSKHFPDVLFTLNGQGEDSVDMWVEYFLDGKVQHEDAVITFAPFNKAKLEEYLDESDLSAEIEAAINLLPEGD